MVGTDDLERIHQIAVLDFEFVDFFEEWLALVETQAPGLAARLPTVRTPGKDEAGGRHVYLRTAGDPIPSGKLARIGLAEKLGLVKAK